MFRKKGSLFLHAGMWTKYLGGLAMLKQPQVASFLYFYLGHKC